MFGPLERNYDLQKVHAGVARSTFRNQTVQNTPVGGTTTWQGGCGRESVAVVDGGGRAVVGRPWYPYHPEHRIWVTINKLPTLYFGIGLNDFYIPCIQGDAKVPPWINF